MLSSLTRLAGIQQIESMLLGIAEVCKLRAGKGVELFAVPCTPLENWAVTCFGDDQIGTKKVIGPDGVDLLRMCFHNWWWIALRDYYTLDFVTCKGKNEEFFSFFLTVDCQ